MANTPYYAEGNYQATIVSHTFTPGQYGVQLVIGIEPHTDGKSYSRTIYLPFLDADENPDKNIERTMTALATIGFAGNPSQLDPQSDNPVSLVGNEITATCKYNQDSKERWYVTTEREPIKPVTKPMLRKLDALFGKELKKNGAKQPPVKKQKAADVFPEQQGIEPEQDGAVDDIPF